MYKPYKIPGSVVIRPCPWCGCSRIDGPNVKVWASHLQAKADMRCKNPMCGQILRQIGFVSEELMADAKAMDSIIGSFKREMIEDWNRRNRDMTKRKRRAMKALMFRGR